MAHDPRVEQLQQQVQGLREVIRKIAITLNDASTYGTDLETLVGRLASDLIDYAYKD
jgi:hypothetical protein